MPNAKVLGSRDAGDAAQVLRLAHDEDFWAKASDLKNLIAPLMDTLSWLRGCDCHEAELLARRQVQCSWKGCRAKSLGKRLGQLHEDYVNIRDRPRETLTRGTSSYDISLFASTIMGLAMVKFAWVFEPPFLIVECGDREKVASFINMYDEAARQGAKTHRVSDYFASPEIGTLRPHLVAFAEGGYLHPTLALEIEAYGAIMLDDSWAESYQRDATRITARFNTAKTAFRAATLRLDQNLALADMTPDGEEALAGKLARWKSIGKCEGSRRLSSRGGATKQVVRDFVYRLGRQGLRDLTPLSAVNSLLPLEDAPRDQRMSTRMKVEYLNYVLAEHSFFSYCEAPPALLDSLQGRPILDQGQAIESASDAPRLTFQLVAKNIGKRKQMKTKLAKEIRAMAFPVMMQEFTPWGERSEGAFRNYYADGYPVVQDLLARASWPTLTAWLRLCSQGHSDTDGLLSLALGDMVASRSWDYRDSGVPLLVLLDHLAAVGWKFGQSALEITPASPKQFQPRNGAKWKAFVCSALRSCRNSWGNLACMRFAQTKRHAITDTS